MIHQHSRLKEESDAAHFDPTIVPENKIIVKQTRFVLRRSSVRRFARESQLEDEELKEKSTDRKKYCSPILIVMKSERSENAFMLV